MAALCVAAVALAGLSLHGCGSDNVSTTTASPTESPSTTVSPTTPSAPTPAPMPSPTPGKQDVYVVLRMDDYNSLSLSQDLADFVDWSVGNKIPINVGIITSVWPTDCLTHPSGDDCNQPSVKSLNKAYTDGQVVGTGDESFIEICDHSWDHMTWASKFTDKAWALNDFKQSAAVLEQAFPKATKRTFIAPECLATSDTLDAMLEHGYDIMSSEGQLGCDEDLGEAPRYNYWYAPCEWPNGGPGQCIPPNDTYFTEDGVEKMANGIISLNAGSANSHMAQAEIGRSVNVTIGVDDCGCDGDEKCPMIASAKQNARKSNGLYWTVLMMHPQNNFKSCCKQTYKEWLEEFLPAVQALKDYTVHFVTFQRLAELHSPAKDSTVLA